MCRADEAGWRPLERDPSFSLYSEGSARQNAEDGW